MGFHDQVAEQGQTEMKEARQLQAVGPLSFRSFLNEADIGSHEKIRSHQELDRFPGSMKRRSDPSPLTQASSSGTHHP